MRNYSTIFANNWISKVLVLGLEHRVGSVVSVTVSENVTSRQFGMYFSLKRLAAVIVSTSWERVESNAKFTRAR